MQSGAVIVKLVGIFELHLYLAITASLAPWIKYMPNHHH